MRTIIAGSRDCTEYNALLAAMRDINWTPSVVLSGTARGVDRMGEIWADEQGIAIERYPAKWYVKGLYDPAAGYKRNDVMATKADALVALWDSQSFGTKHMIDIAVRKGLRVHVHFV